jgi:hypothetical protein
MSADGRTGWRGGRLRRLLGREALAGDGGGSGVAQATAAGGDGAAPGVAEAPGLTRIRDCAEGPLGRPVVRVGGTLRAVHERTIAGAPALRAELDDGTARLEVVWLGRRTIAGVEPGRGLVATGRIAVTRGRLVLFNPRYELQPRGERGQE